MHLFAEGVGPPSDLLRQPDDCWIEDPRHDPGFDCLAAGTFRARGRPAWSEQFEDFDIRWPESVSASAVLLAGIDRRWFAVTFGQGRHLLRTELLVPDFGLRVTANSVDPQRIRTIGAVRLDGVGRRSRQTVAVPSGLGEFDIDVEGEWVRSLGGETDDDLMRGMTGSQSLSVDHGPERRLMKIVPELCGRLLERYHDTTYRTWFPFIDLVVALHRADPRIGALDDALVRTALADPSAIGVLPPDPQPGDDVPARYVIDHGPSLDDPDVLRTLGRGPAPLGRAVHGRDQDGNRVGPVLRLRDCLTAEIECDDESFVLSEGRWFAVDEQRRATLDQEVDAIPLLGSAWLDLPLWQDGDDESVYNEGAARSTGVTLVDRTVFLGPDRRRDKIEVCDLLGPGPDLICVKKLDGARNLSHLFSQGSVSARLYHGDRVYREHVDGLHGSGWPNRGAATPRIVYAIGTRRSGELSSVLPFFSRINLANHARTIRRAGIAVAASWIMRTNRPIVAVPPLPRPRADGSVQLGLDFLNDDRGG